MSEKKANLELSSPWVDHFKKLKTLFKYDDEVHVKLDSEEGSHVIIKLLVDNARKADALSKIIEPEKTFGNITAFIEVVPANDSETIEELFTEAFRDNEVFSYAQTVDTVFGIANYVVFDDVVAQYFNDNVFDIHGNTSTLYQEIAKDVFREDLCVSYCTDSFVDE